MKHGIIYKIQNKVNGKVYIGKTSRTFKRRVKAGNYKSCTALNNSIKVHGWDNFTKEEFICALDKKYLASLEEQAINHFDCIAPKGYNIIRIDKGLNSYTPETRAKISASRKEYLATLTEPVIASTRKHHVLVNGVAHKSCNECDQLFTLDNFNKRSAHWDGLDKYCKPCGRQIRYRPYVRKSEEEVALSYETRNEAMRKGIANSYKNNPELAQQKSQQFSKAVIGVHITSGKTVEYPSALAAKKDGFNNSEIGRSIKNNKPYKQYMWRFK